MNRFFSRLWNLLWKRLSPWFSEESSGAGTPSPSSTPPADLESLRRHAASLCALASQSRLELAELVQEHHELEELARSKISEGADTAARDSLARLQRIEGEMDALLSAHEAQQHAADAAVSLYRQREDEWRKTSSSLKSLGRMERSAERMEAVQRESIRPTSPLPDEISADDFRASPAPSDPVSAAREALRRPAPLSEAERSQP